MNSLNETDDDFSRGDRELTLNTGAILGIFLGLVLLCGLFFGFGYKMGSRKPNPSLDVQASATNAPTAAAVANFSAFKPAAGSPTAGPAAKTTVTVPNTSSPATASSPSSSAVVSPRSALAAEPAPPARTPSPIAVHLGTSPAAASAGSGTGSFVVQIAAVSLQEDANLLVGALRSKGYAVVTRAEPDKLIHIQVGPFGNRKDADAMRQRLLSDGYNAIVK